MSSKTDWWSKYDSQSAIIKVGRRSKNEIITCIMMLPHKTNETPIWAIDHPVLFNEIPDIKKLQDIYFTIFKTVPANFKQLSDVKEHIIDTIISISPNHLYYNGYIFFWNLKRELRFDYLSIAIQKELKNSLFVGSLKNENSMFLESRYFPYLQNNISPNLKYFSKYWNNEIHQKLQSITCETISRNVMAKILDDDFRNDFNYFDSKIGIFLNKLNFVNVYILMNKSKQETFRNKYFDKIQQLNLPKIFIEELKSYCPENLKNENRKFNFFGKVLKRGSF